MDPLWIGFIGVILLFVLIFAGMPLGLAFVLIGTIGYGLAFSWAGALSMVRTVAYSTFSDYGFIVIPLFILMGTLAYATGMSEDLYDSAHSVFGRLRGGLAMATVVASAGFAAICGASVASAATMGKVAYPEMRRYKYDPKLSTASIAVGGTIGILIPPSMIFIIYGIISEQSIGQLYMAGFIPGIFQTLVFIATIYIICRINPKMGPQGPSTTLKEKVTALSRSWPVLILFLLVLGGIYLGWFSANEAAGAGAFLVFFLGLIMRRLSWKGFKHALIDASKTTAMIFIILTGALIFGYFLTITGVSTTIADFMGSLPVSKWVIFAFIMLFYLILGCAMDSMSMILITVPIFYPLTQKLGFDPIWFGVIIVMVVEMGLITPPVGMVVFVIKGIVSEDVPMFTIFKGLVPFLIANIIIVIVLALFPQMALFLPNTMMGN
jgi:C4-dicarboxylate transporter DctM subunit